MQRAVLYTATVIACHSSTPSHTVAVQEPLAKAVTWPLLVMTLECADATVPPTLCSTPLAERITVVAAPTNLNK